ncbi:MAG: helix-turn-helix transcriptional regulator [Immundisolibacteraceae bacterium]|nr:helix-turn-helix transcriptional regulator [Immundisolibacteraceae bacterium]
MDIPTLSKKEEYILDFLRDGNKSYALEMVKNSEGLLKKGTIYVVLYDLEDRGYIKSELENKNPNSIGPARRMYKIDGLGEKVLEAWCKYKLSIEGVFE